MSMPKFQKAYLLGQLRAFPGWSERDTSAGSDEQSKTHDRLDDASVVYLREDLTVSLDCFDDGPALFTNSSPEWEAFCRTSLAFHVPDWEAESRAVREKLAASKRATGPGQRP